MKDSLLDKLPTGEFRDMLAKNGYFTVIDLMNICNITLSYTPDKSTIHKLIQKNAVMLNIPKQNRPFRYELTDIQARYIYTQLDSMRKLKRKECKENGEKSDS